MNSSPTTPPDSPENETPWLQFSLRTIFFVTTAVCIALGVPALGGVALGMASIVGLLVVLMILQAPIFVVLRLLGWLPRPEATEEQEDPPSSTGGPTV